MNIEQLAQESGLLRYLTPPGTDEWHGRTADIARLIRNVTNVERAACAALAEDTAAGRDAEAIAEAIRMRHNANVTGLAPGKDDK